MKAQLWGQAIVCVIVVSTLLFVGAVIADLGRADIPNQGIQTMVQSPVSNLVAPRALGLDRVSTNRVQHAPNRAMLQADVTDTALQIATTIVNQNKSMGRDAATAVEAPALFTVAEKRTTKDSTGNTHVRIQQYYQGIPVVGAELIVHMRNGSAYSTTGKYLSSANMSPVPSIDEDAAVEAGIASIGQDGMYATLRGYADLVIFNNRLAYHFELAQQGDAWGVWKYYVDAHNAQVLFKYNNIQHDAPAEGSGSPSTVTGNLLSGEGGGLATFGGFYESSASDNYFLYNFSQNWGIFDVRANDWEQQGTGSWGSTDRVAVSAANNIAITQDYVSTVLGGMDSFDDEGAFVRLNIHQYDPENPSDWNYVNAYWDGDALFFGDGDDTYSSALTVLDVVAHEYGHAMTQYSSDLIYWMQSGALNEAYSDIFGAAVEFYYQPAAADPLDPGPGQADWLLGEDCWLAGDAMRSIADPSLFEDPSYYKGTNWHFGVGDNGGVHTNSGVLNKAFYLLAEGGSGTNDGHVYNLTGQGVDVAAAIAIQANLNQHTSTDTYYDARKAWIDAATELNYNQTVIDTVDAVFNAVGVPTFFIAQLPDLSLTSVPSQDMADRGGAVYVADDFTLSQSQQIHNIAVQGLLSEGGDTLDNATTLNFYIYGDAGGEPDGNPFQPLDRSLLRLSLSPTDSQLTITETYLGSAQYHSHVNLSLSNPVTLPPGQYWLVFFPVMSLSPHGQFYMAMSENDSGDTAQAMDTSNLAGWPATWTPFTSSQIGAPLSALSFEIESSPVTVPSEQYTVSFDANINGTVLGLTTQIVDEGKDCAAVTADSDTGYMFSHWTGEHTGTDNPLTITNVTSDMTVMANFVVAPQHTVTFVAGDNGTITGESTQIVYQGDPCSAVTAVADTGYVLNGWTGNNFSGNRNPLIVADVTSDMTITATFIRAPTTTNNTGGRDSDSKGGGACFVDTASLSW